MSVADSSPPSARPPAPPEPRAQRRNPILAGAPMLLGFAFMMGVVVTVVFPSGREYAEVTSKQKVDAYSIAYLHVLTRASPKDAHLRFVYVRQLAELGRWDEALGVLDGAPEGARNGPEARALRLELMLARARAIPEGDPARVEAFRVVHAELESLVDIGEASRLRELGNLALELEDPALGARFFLKLADVEAEAEKKATALGEAGRWLRAAGSGKASADAYRRAAETSAEPARKNRYLLSAADSLEAESGACDAAAILGPVAKASTDVPLVARATALMTSCGRAVDAKLLGRRLVSFAPRDEAEQKAQVRRELAAGDAPGALAILRELVAKHPGDPVLREATARVAEWAGQPQVALQQWLWLLETGRVPSGQLRLP